MKRLSNQSPPQSSSQLYNTQTFVCDHNKTIESQRLQTFCELSDRRKSCLLLSAFLNLRQNPVLRWSDIRCWMKIRLLNIRITFSERKTDEKYVFLLLYICRRWPSSLRRKMCLFPYFSHIGENIIYSNKMFEVLIFEKNTQCFILFIQMFVK